jgi:hypothetical protein
MDNSTSASAERSPDGKLIDQLARSGSDLTKLHQIEFTLRFPSQLAAERAELQLTGLAFATKIEPGKTADERVIRATKVMYPVESDLQGLRAKLDAIVAQNRGSHEGWKARVK